MEYYFLGEYLWKVVDNDDFTTLKTNAENVIAFKQ